MELGPHMRLLTWCFYGGKRLQRRPFISPRVGRPQTSWKRPGGRFTEQSPRAWHRRAGTHQVTFKLRSYENINWHIKIAEVSHEGSAGKTHYAKIWTIEFWEAGEIFNFGY